MGGWLVVRQGQEEEKEVDYPFKNFWRLEVVVGDRWQQVGAARVDIEGEMRVRDEKCKAR